MLTVLALLVSCLTAQDPKPEPLPTGAVVRMGSTGTKSTGYHGNVAGISFSPDGKTLASVSDAIRIWDLASGKESLVVDLAPNSNAQSVAISPDGKLLASGDMTRGLVLRELPSGKELRTLTMPGSDSPFGSNYVSHLAFSRDGATLLSIAMDKKLVLWNVASGKPLKELNHLGVRSGGWSADGKLFASGGYQDRSVRVWDAETGRELYQLDGEGE